MLTYTVNIGICIDANRDASIQFGDKWPQRHYCVLVTLHGQKQTKISDSYQCSSPRRQDVWQLNASCHEKRAINVSGLYSAEKTYSQAHSITTQFCTIWSTEDYPRKTKEEVANKYKYLSIAGSANLSSAQLVKNFTIVCVALITQYNGHWKISWAKLVQLTSAQLLLGSPSSGTILM